jgi:hypothetical protein
VNFRFRRKNGEPCGAKAIRGGTVCRMHGGGAPQVKAAAAARLRAVVDPARAVLEYSMNYSPGRARLKDVPSIPAKHNRFPNAAAVPMPDKLAACSVESDWAAAFCSFVNWTNWLSRRERSSWRNQAGCVLSSQPMKAAQFCKSELRTRVMFSRSEPI